MTSTCAVANSPVCRIHSFTDHLLQFFFGALSCTRKSALVSYLMNSSFSAPASVRRARIAVNNA